MPTGASEACTELLRPVSVDRHGHLLVHDDMVALGRSGSSLVELGPEDVVDLPDGSGLVSLPGRYAVGLDEVTGEAQAAMSTAHGAAITGAAALLPVGYTRTYLPAYEATSTAQQLPLMGYTALVSRGSTGELAVTAVRTDDPDAWRPATPEGAALEALVKFRLGRSPGNRVLQQLTKCSLEYGCPTAQNTMLGRLEGGLPVSRACNADCLGCISLQPAECCEAPQSRIDFTPTLEEIVEVAVSHLEAAPGAIISFGQGCEGDPLTEGKLLARAVREIRRQTTRGTINVNTNAGITAAMAELLEAGVDSARVTLFSPVASEYAVYHRPRGYALADVERSMCLCTQARVALSVNLLTFPGFTDSVARTDALSQLFGRAGVTLVQTRNLNIDPDTLMDWLEDHGVDVSGPIHGVRRMIDALLEAVPGLRVGNFSRPRART